MRPTRQNLWVCQQSGQKPGIFQPLPRASALVRQLGVGRIADQPYAAVHVARQLFEFVQSSKGRIRSSGMVGVAFTGAVLNGPLAFDNSFGMSSAFLIFIIQILNY
ncbi:hypothetical protein BK662_24405 [Pseudomonas frederiksbergensis]|uniref:Uncharacterized protein n=1 Tax=Pseudomonas frederiksbergensis TaxID=104087 RepID=A0A423HIU7_9PSED|nr:hypothetical protein BK662_18290 [Pseudomonas frederiksbergensis]RON14258.1 hypothetical protein BK662_24405 [Pseudomonas frederiksbergensis]